ncbi:MAG: carbon starvation protein A [Candidatus Omnitrophota bacterium]
MNAISIILITLTALLLGYRFYARKIERLWQTDPTRQPPSVTRYDGIDYIPAQNWLVLFGHHFASIAGAGPIIGPAIAVCYWGWAPALLWVILGSIFIGGIHDFGALMISVRENGSSIGDIAERSISRNAKIIFSLFIWLALILVVAVFAYFGAETFVKQPAVVLPSLGLIPLAVVVGLALYRFKWNPLVVTIAGLSLLGILLIAGWHYPIELPGNSLLIWILVLLMYSFFASIIPVNILLQPRDYLSSFLLMGGIFLALLGILVSHPQVNTPAFMPQKTATGYLWPMMFITIACGATSGFHSLIASGTTSKQLPNEKYAKLIGFGGMLLEGFLAAIVIVLIISGFTLGEFNSHIANKTSPVNMYGLSFGNVTRPFLGKWGTFIAITILNAFILTTLDSATRIARYITEEFLRIKNRYLSTLLVVSLGAWLAISKDSMNKPLWEKIWPAFGASNQLVAALALLVISCWLLSKKKATYYSLIPACFMLVTSLTALFFQIKEYLQNNDFVLIIVSLVLVGSALFLIREIMITFRKGLRHD